MKEVVMCCLMFASLDFCQSLVFENDALGVGIGLDLMKNGHLMAYESNLLHPHETHYLIHNRNMLAIEHALAKYGT